MNEMMRVGLWVVVLGLLVCGFVVSSEQQREKDRPQLVRFVGFSLEKKEDFEFCFLFLLFQI